MTRLGSQAQPALAYSVGDGRQGLEDLIAERLGPEDAARDAYLRERCGLTGRDRDHAAAGRRGGIVRASKRHQGR